MRFPRFAARECHVTEVSFFLGGVLTNSHRPSDATRRSRLCRVWCELALSGGRWRELQLQQKRLTRNISQETNAKASVRKFAERVESELDYCK